MEARLAKASARQSSGPERLRSTGTTSTVGPTEQRSDGRTERTSSRHDGSRLEHSLSGGGHSGSGERRESLERRELLRESGGHGTYSAASEVRARTLSRSGKSNVTLDSEVARRDEGRSGGGTAAAPSFASTSGFASNDAAGAAYGRGAKKETVGEAAAMSLFSSKTASGVAPNESGNEPGSAAGERLG